MTMTMSERASLVRRHRTRTKSKGAARDSRRGVGLSLVAAVVAPVLATGAIFAGASGVASGSPEPQATSSTPFLLGVGTPLTGDEANYGIPNKDAITLAADYVNSHGGMLGHKLEIEWYDTQALPADGVAATQYFISHHVNAVVGYFDSSVTIPSVKLLESAGIPLFGDNPSTPELATMGLKNFVRITSNDADEGLVQAKFAWSKGYRTAVTVDDDEIFGDAFAAAFTQSFEKLGGKVLKPYTTQISTTDFGSVLAQIKTLKPAIISYAGFNPAAALLLKQARADGITTPYITDSSQVGTQFIQIAGKAAVGAFMSDDGGGTNNALYSQVAAELKSKYNVSLTPIVGNEYDAVLAVQKAVQLAKSIEPSRIIAVMHKVSFEGTTGPVSFIADGDRAQVSFIVVQISPKLNYNTVYKYATVLQ
jgi:branched-chain amino acid transport system substrate-binding protein